MRVRAVQCAAPNAHIYRFDSRLHFDRKGVCVFLGFLFRLARADAVDLLAASDDQGWLSVSLQNTVWQSTQLRNTKEVREFAFVCVCARKG